MNFHTSDFYIPEPTSRRGRCTRGRLKADMSVQSILWQINKGVIVHRSLPLRPHQHKAGLKTTMYGLVKPRLKCSALTADSLKNRLCFVKPLLRVWKHFWNSECPPYTLHKSGLVFSKSTLCVVSSRELDAYLRVWNPPGFPDMFKFLPNFVQFFFLAVCKKWLRVGIFF